MIEALYSECSIFHRKLQLSIAALVPTDAGMPFSLKCLIPVYFMVGRISGVFLDELYTPLSFHLIFTARRVCIAQTMPSQDVCLSVCLSVTRRYSVDTAERVLEIF